MQKQYQLTREVQIPRDWLRAEMQKECQLWHKREKQLAKELQYLSQLQKEK